jgi:uncharacterized RDD family membrane protein YckC
VFVDRISVITPERVLVEHEIAGVGSRAVAQMIDGIVLGVGYGLIVVLVRGMARASAPSWLLLTVLIVLLAALPLAYFIVLEARYGATLGKRAMRIRVLTEYGAPIGLRESVTRNLLRVIDILPLGYALGAIVAIISSRSQRLGDIAAGTVAVRMAKVSRTEAKRASGSFVDMVAEEREQTQEGLVSGELIAVIAQFESRMKKLTPQARSDLAGRIARRAALELPRPHDFTDEQFIAYIHNREYI